MRNKFLISTSVILIFFFLAPIAFAEHPKENLVGCWEGTVDFVSDSGYHPATPLMVEITDHVEHMFWGSVLTDITSGEPASPGKIFNGFIENRDVRFTSENIIGFARHHWQRKWLEGYLHNADTGANGNDDVPFTATFILEYAGPVGSYPCNTASPPPLPF